MEAIRLFLEERQDDVGAAVFDKDDDLAVEFVTAAANLRSIAYNIPTQSLFAAKVGPVTCKPAPHIWLACTAQSLHAFMMPFLMDCTHQCQTS